MVSANSLPKKIRPRSSINILTTAENSLAEIGVSLATSAAAPVTPPKTKLLGNLKKYTPTAIMLMPSVMIVYCRTIFIHLPFMVGSFPLAFQRSYSTEIITPNPPFAIPCPAGFEVGCA